jgi:SAM-dependent methyltransferase
VRENVLGDMTSLEAPMDELRTALRAIWGSAAGGWGDHADFVDARGAVVTEAMLDAAYLQRGQRVLELACGPGGVGLVAAPIVGPDGEVVLSDVAPEMTAIALERARNAELTNVTTRDLDIEHIDYPDSTFDAVLCREGLMLVPDPASAVREAHRILRPEGHAVFTVWGPRQRNPWLGTLFDAITAQLGMPFPPAGIPGPFALDDPGALDVLLGATGFDGVAVREIQTPMHVSSIDEWWSVVPSLAGAVSSLLASLPAEANAAIRAHVDAALAEFAAPDGYELPGVSVLGVGIR